MINIMEQNLLNAISVIRGIFDNKTQLSNPPFIKTFINNLETQLDFTKEINGLLQSIGEPPILSNKDNDKFKTLCYLVRYFYNDFIQYDQDVPLLFNNITTSNEVLYYYKYLINKRYISEHLEEYASDDNYSFDDDEDDDEDEDDETNTLRTELGQLTDKEIIESFVTWGKLLIRHSDKLYRGVYHNYQPITLNHISFSPFTTDSSLENKPIGMTISHSSGEILFKTIKEIGIFIIEQLGESIDIDTQDFHDWVSTHCVETNIYKDTIICQYLKHNELAIMLSKSRLTTPKDMDICPSYGLAQIVLGLIYDENYGIKPYLDKLKGLNPTQTQTQTWMDWGVETALQAVSFARYGEHVANYVIRLLKRLAQGKLGLKELDIQLSLLDTHVIEKIIGINLRQVILEQIFYYLREFGLTIMDSNTYKQDIPNTCYDETNQNESVCSSWDENDWLQCANQRGGYESKIEDSIITTCRNPRYNDTLLCESLRGNKIARQLMLGKLTDNQDKWKTCPHSGLANVFTQLVYSPDSVLNQKTLVFKTLQKLGVIKLIKKVLIRLAKGEFTWDTLDKYLNSLTFSKTLSRISFSKIHRKLKQFILNNYVFYYLRDFGLTSLDERLKLPSYSFQKECGRITPKDIDDNCRSWEQTQWRTCPLNQVQDTPSLTNEHTHQLQQLDEDIITITNQEEVITKQNENDEDEDEFYDSYSE